VRRPSDPYEEADEGEMRYTYALFLHEGDVRNAQTLAVAYELNDPMQALVATADASTLPTAYSLLTVSDPRVVCETVKESEDGEDTVLRLYESKNKKGNVTLTLDERFKTCFL